MTHRTIVVDGANVVGSRPDGWWRDRAGAAARLHDQLIAGVPGFDEVILVLEGQARPGVAAGVTGVVRTVHAPHDGDATIVAVAEDAVVAGAEVTVVTSDRELRGRVCDVGAAVIGPGRLRELLS